MDKVKVANELVKLAKELLAGDYSIGFTWNSVSQNKPVKRKLVFFRKSPTGNESEDRWEIETEGMRLNQLLHPKELDREIYVNEHHYKKYLEKKDKGEDSNGKKEGTRTHGFAEQYPPMKRGRIVSILSKQFNFGGDIGIKTRQQYIEDAYKKGWERQGQRLVSPTGTFVDRKVLTDVGYDYFSYLKDNRISL